MLKAWPLKRKERTIHRRPDGDTNMDANSISHRNQNIGNLNSNNVNNNVGRDEISITVNWQNITNVADPAEKVSNEARGPSLGFPSTNMSSSNPSSSARPSETPVQSIASSSERRAPSISARHTTTDLTERGRLSGRDSFTHSVPASESEYPDPKEIKPKNIRSHLPKNTDEYIQAYMSSTALFGSKLMIPLWKPSPSNEIDARKWRHHIHLGDVGIFNAAGGFDTLFNILISTSCNHERGYEPPSDFIPYSKPLEEMNLEIGRVKFPSAKGIKTFGFKAVSQQSSSAANPSYQADASYCSAICLRSGFLKLGIEQWEGAKILKYMRTHEESWQRHVEETTGTRFNDRPLMVVFETWRTQSCALVTGSRPWPQKCEGIITLKESVESGHTHHEWEVAGDNYIFTQFGPSPQLVENQDSYFRAMKAAENSEYSPTLRKEIEECHCVAVRVMGLRKGGRRQGGSVKSGRSSKTTIKAIWAKMHSLPTQLDLSIQEELEF